MTKQWTAPGMPDLHRPTGAVLGIDEGPDGRLRRTEAPRNGLEAAPLERWVCDGRDRRGHVCGATLMELALERGTIRVRCRKCGAWHTRLVG